MDDALNPGLHNSTQLVSATRILCLLSGCLQDELIHQPLPSIPHSHRLYPLMLIYSDEAAGH